MIENRNGDRTEDRWFEEYRELSLSWRADDERLSKLTTVLVPISFAAFALNDLLSMGGGLSLMIYWWFAARITVKKLSIRFDRMREIEKELGFDAHLRYFRCRKKGVLKDSHIRGVLLAIYVIIVIVKATLFFDNLLDSGFTPTGFEDQSAY